ncbi:MAG: hypothetical protein EZS28_025193 [Streblomastix strix]|uniref:Uncharacterized protein n=1 Tax=Streblomastix strix TaxID=222440 RepID=A0A5J4V9N7_9EUKA|nr:MAG: hypothetical protein EZS28_025193 [Streblomastix strix]
MIAPWWPGQIWFSHLLTDSSRYFIIGESSRILNQGKEMIKKKDMLPPEKIAALLMDHELIKEGVPRQCEHGLRNPTNDNRVIQMQHLEKIYVDNGSV